MPPRWIVTCPKCTHEFTHTTVRELAGRESRDPFAMGMRFTLQDRVKRIGQQEVYTIIDIREPDEHIIRLNSTAETMYWVQLGSDLDTRVWVKESELEPEE